MRPLPCLLPITCYDYPHLVTPTPPNLPPSHIPYQAPAFPPVSPTLSPEHLLQIQEASRNARRIRRAVSVARFDGYTLALFAALTFVFGLSDRPSIVIAGIMATVAGVELHTAFRLQRLDPAASRIL